MSQNKVGKHLQTLSTKTEQKFKGETENREVPILKINLLHRTVCEVARTDYLNRRITSKNEDHEDKNISSSESILHKFPESRSDKVCLTKNVVLKSLVENIDVNKKRRRAKCIGNGDKGPENISSSIHAFKNDILKKTAVVKSSKVKDSNVGGNEKCQERKANFSVSELQESISEGKQKRRKRKNSGSNIKKPSLQVQQCSKAVPHKFYTQSDSNAKKLVKFTKKCNEGEKSIQTKQSFIPISKNEVSLISTENVAVQTPFLIERYNNYVSSTLYEPCEDFPLSSVGINDTSIDLSKPPGIDLDENESCSQFPDNSLPPLIDLSEEPSFSFDKVNDCSSSMPDLSALPLPCDVNHCNTINAVNNNNSRPVCVDMNWKKHNYHLRSKSTKKKI
ncbi:hypothetical protein CEXT_730231 [Caerostris extrusa]|uniref:Uncharacterized protein n=1 Tax=Caerostris extrusa TaxID=172846 RepID=A0AAV4NSA5_CAEEX|nr:hypothetical protein CEXT_730231 [Caerostris extrusa]